MDEDDALFRALVAAPEDLTLRLAYADRLEEHGHPGAAYLRAEVALFRADPGGRPAGQARFADHHVVREGGRWEVEGETGVTVGCG